MRRHLLVVLGMHRSGTSALAGALAKAGAFPGRELMPPTADNPDGYWECLPIVRFNDRLLGHVGARWDSIASLPANWPALPTMPALRAEAIRIMTTQYAGADVAVLKDPRLCRLLPFWHDVFSEAGFAASFALMVRRPAEVAASLARRDQFAPEKSLALWLAHVCAAERDSRGHPRAFVPYDRLLAEPENVLREVCADVSFPLRLTDAQRTAAASVVKPELKRQRRVDPRDAPRETLASGLDRVLDEGYGLLTRPSSAADPFAAIAGLPSASRAALAAAVPPWLAEELATMQAQAQKHAVEINDLARQIDDLARQVDAARADHLERDKLEAALREHAARGERDLADERATIATLTEELDRARAGADDQLRQIASARESIEALVAELEVARANSIDQTQQLDAARETIDALVAEIATARTNAELRERQVEDMVGSLEDKARQAAERDRREAALRTDVQRLSDEAGALRSERDALAPALRETREAAAAVSADRDRLAALERGARERSALLDSRIATLQADVFALRARDAANTAELARLSRRWYGRLARRLASRG